MRRSTSVRHSTAESANWIENFARFGYAAKGAVYGIIGFLAARAAFGTGGDAGGTRRALREIAEQPYGQILLGITATCLIGYVIWQFVRAVKDPEHKGTDLSGITQRLGYFASGVAYALLALWAFSIVLGLGGGGGSSKQEWTARVLAQPYGPWLVGGVGLAIIGAGLYHFYNVYSARFMRRYRGSMMNLRQRRIVRRLGQTGLSARGITFLIIGTFVIQAARQSDPSEARGLGAALRTLADQPYGPWLLGGVGIGFIAYGIYCFMLALYRQFETS